MIKALVLSGGSYNGFNMLGALFALEEKKYIDFDKIESIYCTSAGSIIAIIWLLRFKKDIVYNYIINCPWQKRLNISDSILFDIINNIGIVDKDLLLKIYEPLFNSQNIDIKITLRELFKLVNINIYFYATKFNNFEKTVFTHITHPELSVVDAVYMSASLPYIFKPMFYEDSYYLDGALKCHFPINDCLEVYNKDNILGIKIIRKNEIKSIEQGSDVLEFSIHLLNNIINKTSEMINNMDNIIIIKCDPLGSKLTEVLCNKDVRKEMLNNGEAAADDFIRLREETHQSSQQ